MKIKKIYNNNIVLVEDDKLLERVIIGKGIAFQKKVWDEIDPAKIEKQFVIDAPELSTRFMELINEIPMNHLELTYRIIEEAQKNLGITFSDAIYIGLTDHINYALYRYKQNLPIKNRILWEIKRFYPNEYKAAKQSLKTIAYYENIWLPEDEAGFIALHFVNATRNDSDMETMMQVTEIIYDVIKIIQVHFGIVLDENSINYHRMITHIRYFAERFCKKRQETSDDDVLFQQVMSTYPRSYACVCKINDYFVNKYDTQLSKEEMMYLMLHITRVTQRTVE